MAKAKSTNNLPAASKMNMPMAANKPAAGKVMAKAKSAVKKVVKAKKGY